METLLHESSHPYFEEVEAILRKMVFMITLASMLLAMAPMAVPAQALKPGTDFNGTHFNLNLVGKKSGWSGGGTYDNPDRHTIFVPQYTTGYLTSNGQPGITIWMTQGTDFAVLDGEAITDGDASFQLGPGHYKVYVVASAKPGGTTDITGWYYDVTTNSYYLSTGTVTVSRSGGKPQWKDATGLFYVSGSWIFEYLASLSTMTGDAYAYFWQYDNQGNRLVQVRFYPD